MEIEEAIEYLESEVEDIYSLQKGFDEETFDYKLAQAIAVLLKRYKTYRMGYEDFKEYVNKNTIYRGDIEDKVRELKNKYITETEDHNMVWEEHLKYKAKIEVLEELLGEEIWR